MRADHVTPIFLAHTSHSLSPSNTSTTETEQAVAPAVQQWDKLLGPEASAASSSAPITVPMSVEKDHPMPTMGTEQAAAPGMRAQIRPAIAEMADMLHPNITLAPIRAAKTAPSTPPSAQGSGQDMSTHVTKPRLPTRRPQLVRPRPALRPLAPAPIRGVGDERKKTNFYDLPAEIRIEIYKLALSGVRIQILSNSSQDRHCPHALVRTSHQVRMEVLPLIHSICPIRANVTNFNFSGILEWMRRIPADQQHYLCRNLALNITLCTTGNVKEIRGQHFRRWLQMRADKHRPQPNWVYTGPEPKRSVANELRRRVKRMPEEGKKAEMNAMLVAIGVVVG